ncbi:MAG: hypothetical protein H0A76_02105 [Candidatus Thiodubiliella endoseptemdiera]|uniref:Uncharacterized protein n=1 Tax=Candidatus Thiodubiliella endoseptemdiera TaxID=2738886 RepID=A0A853EYV0_9GAMM|nr:hypothetical protein [Candidatus Thiodubiliella endoseptemdiera]
MSETLKLNNTTGSKVVIAGKDFVLDKLPLQLQVIRNWCLNIAFKLGQHCHYRL